jgi:hypothetical protein
MILFFWLGIFVFDTSTVFHQRRATKPLILEAAKTMMVLPKTIAVLGGLAAAFLPPCLAESE